MNGTRSRARRETRGGDGGAGDPVARYREVRATTESLCEPLGVEDCLVQSMPDVSPPKWHLAHTTWFFETFVLKKHVPGYEPFDDSFEQLLNSYYQTVGAPFPRASRGLLSRPSFETVVAYRRHVDRAVITLLREAPDALSDDLEPVVELGLSHEQQHQELLLMDVKHNFAMHPSRPAYREGERPPRAKRVPELRLEEYGGGRVAIGHEGADFCFDNEGPRHEVLLPPYRLASRLITCGEYLEFVHAGGYTRPEPWLADGWETVRRQGWRAPAYWEEKDGEWTIMTLHGERPLNAGEPVCHLSYYEADAFARWLGKRLPREEEWEAAAAREPLEGHFLESGRLHPGPAPPARNGRLRQMFGDLWEWTQSPYAPYPGYRPLAGPFGEYNAKFMVNQMVLRGGSCVTPQSHVRVTYRNYFYPHQRWQFAGLRLAEDVR